MIATASMVAAEPSPDYIVWAAKWTLLLIAGGLLGSLAGKNALSFLDFAKSYLVAFCGGVVTYAAAVWYIRQLTGEIEHADTLLLLYYGISIAAFILPFTFCFFAFIALDERT